MISRFGPFFMLLFTTSLCALPEALRQEIIQFNRRNALPGLAIGIYYQSKPYFLNFGYSRPRRGIKVTEHTIFDIASITKTFIATALAFEVLQNRMRLDDPIALHFPFLRNHPAPIGQIILEQLATHTSSLPRESNIRRQSKRRVLNSLLGWRPRSPFGTKFEYSNLGYKLLRFAVENSAHRSFDYLLRQEITGPLGMRSTFLHLPPELRFRYSRGFSKMNRLLPPRKDKKIAGSLKSTSADLMKFLRANMGLYGPLELYRAMQLAHKGLFQVNPRTVQGLAWQNFTRDGLHLIDKNGGVAGYASWIGWDAENKNAAILLTNKRCPQLTSFGRRLLTQLARFKRE